MEKKLEKFFDQYVQFHKTDLSSDQKQDLVTALESNYQAWFLSAIIQETEEIMAIDPDNPTRKILETAAERIVQYLEADAATIRIFDVESMHMTSFGSYGVPDSKRHAAIPLKDSIAGLVVTQKRAIAVSNILKHPLFKDKSMVNARGFHSLLAVPLFAPVPMLATGQDLLGTMQIYYREKDKIFSRLEVILAELLARRISFVLAKKKILDLQKLNQRKEAIVNNIFFKLSRREGIKLKNLFILMIPELEEMLGVQGCSLFTVSDDQQYLHLEASYPPDVTYHEANYNFTVSHHPYFETAIFLPEPHGDREHERVTSSYLLIKHPVKSALISDRLHDLVKANQIHSILLVPLKVGGQVRHLMAFYASRQRQAFTEEEVELFIFFGKEIMKASRLEFLDDVLHDIKNPAIALSGFARRALKLLKKADLEDVRPRLTSYLEIMASEAARMQDLAQAMSGAGREETLDLSAIARQRFRILEEVVSESKMQHVTLKKPTMEENLFIVCPRFGLERILDNLLGNAARAVPAQGGDVVMSGRRVNDSVVLTVENSGEIEPGQLENIRKAGVKGRGLHIISKFVLANHGNMAIEAKDGVTRFIISLPLARKAA